MRADLLFIPLCGATLILESIRRLLRERTRRRAYDRMVNWSGRGAKPL